MCSRLSRCSFCSGEELAGGRRKLVVQVPTRLLLFSRRLLDPCPSFRRDWTPSRGASRSTLQRSALGRLPPSSCFFHPFPAPDFIQKHLSQVFSVCVSSPIKPKVHFSSFFFSSPLFASKFQTRMCSLTLPEAIDLAGCSRQLAGDGSGLGPGTPSPLHERPCRLRRLRAGRRQARGPC